MIKQEIYKHLPQRLTEEINSVYGRIEKFPEEIRIRRQRRASLTYASDNIMLNTVVSGDEMLDILKSICQGSLYAYKERIANGYIPLGKGVRVGLCGSAFCENGKINSVYDITSIVIRIPKKTEIAAEPLCNFMKKNNYRSSYLIYSSSGVGKTTILRSAAHILSSGNNPLRVCVVDTREEIGALLGGSGLCVDIMRGYPKETGIEIGARTLNAQIIICDEIFGEREAAALCGAVNCGIPILCSAHAEKIEQLLKRKGIDSLHALGVFDYYVGIKRGSEEFVFEFDIKGREEVSCSV